MYEGSTGVLNVGCRWFLGEGDDDLLIGLGLIALRATVVYCKQYTANGIFSILENADFLQALFSRWHAPSRFI